MLGAWFTGEHLELRETPRPPCPAGGLVVKVASCAVCGTDVKILRKADVKLEGGKQRQMPLPRVLGHEFSAAVAEVGAAVTGFAVGERVVVAPTVPCGRCHYCLGGNGEMCETLKVVAYDWDGGFSEYMRVEPEVLAAGCVVRIPDGVDDDPASLAVPISCALNCLELSPVKPGGTVGIVGSGPLGVIFSDLVRWKGASTVIIAEKSPEQIETASRICGADFFINNSEQDLKARVLELTGGRGVDLLIIACSSVEAQSVALDVVAKRGWVNLFAGLPRNNSIVSWDTNLVHYKECSVTGTHGSRPEHVRQALDLMASGVIRPERYITNRFPLSQIDRAMATAMSPGRLKIVVKP